MNEDSSTNVEVRPEMPAAAATTLRQQVVSGIGWKIATQVVVQTTRIVVGVALARLLVPRDFGLASMALLFVGVTSVFPDLSLGQALIARRTITENDRSTAFWTTLAAGAACAGGGVGAAPLVADFFSTPAVAPLFAVTSILFLITSFSSTQIALLTREMQFRSLQLRAMAGAVAGGVVGVALALGGLGAWALIVQALTAEGVSLVLVWRFSPWRPRATYSTESLRRLGSFAGKTSGARLLGYVNLNADNFLIARFLGAAPLGVYSVAYNVMFAPLARAGVLLAFMIFSATITVSSFAIGLHWGVVGVAAGFAAARTAVLPVFTTIVCRAARIRVLAFVGSIRPVLEVSAAMGVLAYALRLGLHDAGLAAGFRLAAVVGAGAAVYVALLVWREPDLVAEVRTLVRRRGR